MLLFVYLLSVFTMAILVALSNTLGTFSRGLSVRLSARGRTQGGSGELMGLPSWAQSRGKETADECRAGH